MGKNKLKAIHSNYHDGYVGKIPDEDMYEDVKKELKIGCRILNLS